MDDVTKRISERVKRRSDELGAPIPGGFDPAVERQQLQCMLGCTLRDKIGYGRH